MDGVINILKPPGMTSHDVVDYLRKKIKIKKIGHTGTLDPGAAGVLPVCIGKATKIVEYLTSDIKEYICELTLGNATDTYDKYGNFLYENIDYSGIDLIELNKVLTKFIGEIEQKPPKFSAIKINGKRAYDLARKGLEFDVPSRKVKIFNIEVLGFNAPKALLKVECSKGTYIRTLCNDIGEELKVNGYMSFLLRTRTGRFNIKDAIPLDAINEDTYRLYMVKMEDALEFQRYDIDSKYKKMVLNGNRIKIKEDLPNQLVKMFCQNEFLGIGKIEDKILKVEKLLI
ncbi:MAG: tRNA pseudouridine(55) synthase TruB [Caloramator sp.]|nr:tRNA pseudouridine(55) synthase TruB [Caloramator sp.]